jgi:carboxypeptidase Q
MYKHPPIARNIAAFAVLLTLTVGPASGAENSGELAVDTSVIPPKLVDQARILRDRALEDNLSVDIVESVTTEVGARRAGTAGGRRAIAWSQEKFRQLGFDRVWAEEFQLERGWIRGEARAEVLAPYPHNIVMTALGYSVGTDGDLIGEIVEFARFADLEAVPEGDSLKGKIVFISYSMADYVPAPDEAKWTSYSEGTKARSRGAVTAAKRGAEAIIIRSVGLDNNRYAHTGSGYGYVDGTKKIPGAAISAPDAILLQNILRRGAPVTFKMNMSSEITGPVMSANVIGEITGREDPDRFVVLGAHLDSWDEGTGALDDGAGIGAMMGAAALVGQMEMRPRRSIRVILFGAEEMGLYGAKAYLQAHHDITDSHLLGAEVDTGDGRARTVTSSVGEGALPVVREMYKLIAPLGIAWNNANNAQGQTDMVELSKAGMPAFNLEQNPNDYMLHHHSPNDTFDKIIPEDMRYLTAAYATLFYLAAELDVDFRK